MVTAYWNYVRVEELLALQQGLADSEDELSNDEVMFIVIHQIHELWFKLALRELEQTRDLFHQNPVPETSLASAVRGLRRVARIFAQATQHLGLMETMTTRDYLDFRDKLIPASGFQSAQFRELEILLGLAAEDRIHLGHDNSYLEALEGSDGQPSPAQQRVQRRLQDRPTFREALAEWLLRTPIAGSRLGDQDDDQAVDAFLQRFLASNELELQQVAAAHPAPNAAEQEALQQRYAAQQAQTRDFLLAPDRSLRRVRAAILFIESYRELPLLAWPREILDRVIELEQGFIIFRQRHARMVERIIGRRIGTGGSAGVQYLDDTALAYRVFPDIWAVRTLLLRQEAIPPLDDEDAYQFRAETSG